MVEQAVAKQGRQEGSDDNQPSLPQRPGQEQDSELSKKIDAVKERLQKTKDAALGTKDDPALQFVKAEYDAAVRRHTVPLKEQLDALTKELRADGRFDAADIRKLQEFQQRMQKGAAEPPAELQEIGRGLQYAERLMTAGTVERQAALFLNRKLVSEKPRALLEAVYSGMLKNLHEFEKKAAAGK